MKKKLKVLLLFDSPFESPYGYDFKEEFADPDDMYTENEVYLTLEWLRHHVRLLGICKDLKPLFREIETHPPDVVFNLVEVFNEQAHLDKNIPALLQLMGIPYTGASPETLFICNDKAMSKKILTYHKLKVPRFQTFYRGRSIRLAQSFPLPCIVKPLTLEASNGISQASIVDSKEALLKRIQFIHERMKTDVIVEEYIEGRELYVSVIGRKKIHVLPSREMKFGSIPKEEPHIATYKAKWDPKYRKRWGIKNVFTGRLPKGVGERVSHVCKEAYQALNIQSYARFDLRVTPSGEVYIIEVNANPCIAEDDEVALSANKVNIRYQMLIDRILRLSF
jgi:D-alanine-D-alanine ligase